MTDQSELDRDGPALAADSAAAAGSWARARDHKVIQWGVGYLGAALALAHGQELVAHAPQWPDLLGRILVILLIVGFPIALTLAICGSTISMVGLRSGSTRATALFPPGALTVRKSSSARIGEVPLSCIRCPPTAARANRGKSVRMVGTRADVWLAGGKLLVVQLSDNDSDIVETAVEAKGEVDDVAATDDLEYHAALSPNGRWLAYISNRTGESEVWVQPYPKGVAERVSRGGRAREPVWSHDGKELFYLRANTMMDVAVETDGEFSFGPSVQLFSEPYVVHRSVYRRSYDVARDGRFLMIQRGTVAGDAAGLSSILVVQNWFAELERRVPTE